MSEQRTVGLTAPVKQKMLDDPQMVGKLTAMLMAGVRIELDKVCEGQPYQIEKIRLVISGNGPSFTRNLFDADIQVTVTVDEL